MKLNESNETVEYAGHDIVNILKEIDYMLISLHRMGSFYCILQTRRTAFDRRNREIKAVVG